MSLLCYKACYWITEDLHVLFCQTALQPGGSQHVLVPGVVPPLLQDFALSLLELHEVPVSPFLHPVEVPLDGSMTLWPISRSSEFGMVSKLDEGCTVPHHPDH